jgi:Fur family transcriptional regulator, peroxide stress response regulator
MNRETDNKAEERLAQMLARIKGPEFRLTPQRLAILEILASSDDHPSVDDIYREIRVRFPTTSLATVYKTVSMLKGNNEVLELGFPDGSNRYDGKKPYPHPHAICTICKKIQDPEIATVDELSKEMQKKTGFTISYHRLDFFGICPECQGKG